MMPFTKVAATIQYYYRAAAVVDLAHTIIHIYDLFFSVPTPTPRYSICTFFLKSSGGGGGGRYREIKKKKKYLGMFDRDVMMFTFVLYIA
jgi:hypothetical protein